MRILSRLLQQINPTDTLLCADQLHLGHIARYVLPSTQNDYTPTFGNALIKQASRGLPPFRSNIEPLVVLARESRSSCRHIHLTQEDLAPTMSFEPSPSSLAPSLAPRSRRRSSWLPQLDLSDLDRIRPGIHGANSRQGDETGLWTRFLARWGWA